MTSLDAVVRRMRVARDDFVATLIRCARAYRGDGEAIALPRHYPG